MLRTGKMKGRQKIVLQTAKTAAVLPWNMAGLQDTELLWSTADLQDTVVLWSMAGLQVTVDREDKLIFRAVLLMMH